REAAQGEVIRHGRENPGHMRGVLPDGEKPACIDSSCDEGEDHAEQGIRRARPLQGGDRLHRSQGSGGYGAMVHGCVLQFHCGELTAEVGAGPSTKESRSPMSRAASGGYCATSVAAARRAWGGMRIGIMISASPAGSARELPPTKAWIAPASTT